ncbi:hypothetical protein K7J14_09785 [Treponema zuelzerae]|uniref:Methyl-accepting transducer domain-containing protein n=1 Tax=Teretinema zuelzerae TaxID=156 RepID=A0AAE3JLP3_9SPIR|nr:methyl-accepting chemotaxis protein [Teretinema zuelzerae]MCD1654989.1 hypothetical protein [Teretinema zuelzerae]
MRTGFKITLFSVSLIFLLCCTAGAFLLVVSPANRIQRSHDVLVALDGSLSDFQTELYRSVSAPAPSRREALAASLQSVQDSASRLASPGDLLAFGNEALIAELSSSADLADLLSRSSRVLPGYEDLSGDPSDQGLRASWYLSADALSSRIDSFRGLLADALAALNERILDYRILSFMVSAGIIVSTWLLGLFAVWLLSRSVSRATRQVTSLLECMSNGDFSSCAVELSEKPGNDAVSRMGDFVKSVHRLVSSVKAEASRTLETSTNLSSSLDNTSSTFEVVDGFIESIRNEVITLEEQVKIVKTGLDRVTTGLNSLDAGIMNQKEVVEGSMSSVDGMIGVISDMAEDLHRDEKVIQDLVRSSDQGQQLFSSTYQKITLISESISRINGMASVIENIAEQTNMLALNAAIEAAHAGDQGKGFAVVAEEITKLAEASSESSREIGSSIEEIVDNITQMASSSGDLEQAFEDIASHIGIVYSTIKNFADALVSSDRDSKQVRDTMKTLGEVSQNVTKNAGSMSEGAGAIAHSMRELDMISSRVFDGVTALSLMLDGLKDVMGEFKQQAESMKDSGAAMNETLSQLK